MTRISHGMSTEYSTALAAAKARREQARLDVRARVLLGHAGWAASRQELEAAAEEAVIQPAMREAIVAAAVGLQSREQAKVRRIDVNSEVGRTMARKLMPPEIAERIKEHVSRRRAEDPKLTAEPLRLEVNEKFGVDIQPPNFFITYWPGTSKPGRKPAKKKAPAARKPRTLGRAVPTAAATSKPSTSAGVSGAVRSVTVLNAQRLQVVIEFDVAELLGLARANGART